MARRQSGLFSQVTAFENLVASARLAAKGKRRTASASRFLNRLETNCLQLNRRLNERSWRPSGFKMKRVLDPKPRWISVAPFKDRVVHHALCRVVCPVFERGFIFDSYANRKGKGTHAAVKRYERYRDRHSHVLRADIFRYFPAIDHEILKSVLRRKLGCNDTLWLADTIIDGSNEQEPVDIFFPGDRREGAEARRRGLPIGNLTSQFFANAYLDHLDHYVKEVLRAPYVRYVDDFALFADSEAELADWQADISRFLIRYRLLLHPDKTLIASTREPAEFLGYVLHATGRRSLPEANVRRFRNKLRGHRDRWRGGKHDLRPVQGSINAWIAHAEHADTWRLRQSIFKGGLFDPSLEA